MTHSYYNIQYGAKFEYDLVDLIHIHQYILIHHQKNHLDYQEEWNLLFQECLDQGQT